MTGVSQLLNLFTKVVSLAICIIPLHKHIVPIKLIDKLTASSTLENIDLFKTSIFPEKIEYMNDIIIKIGHNIFNKTTT